MKQLAVENFRTLCKEVNAQSVSDIQHRKIPELKEDQTVRGWVFSDARDKRSLERMLQQWGSVQNLSAFVLSDKSGIETLGGGLFGGMFYRANSDDHAYSTPGHEEVFVTRDGRWEATATYEHTWNPPYNVCDFVLTVKETFESVERIWVFRVADLAKFDEAVEAIPGSNIDILDTVEGNVTYQDAEVGQCDFIPVYGDAVMDVPERYNAQSISDPYLDGEVLGGTYRSAGISFLRRTRSRQANDFEYVLIQVIRRWYREESDYSKIGTVWDVKNGESYHSGSDTLVLEMRNVDPDLARRIAQSLPVSPDSFTNEIYTRTDGLIEGTWYNRTARYQIEDDGSGTVQWVLTKHNNDDFWVAYYSSTEKAAFDFYKINATDTSKEDFQSNYYFAPDLNWYYREGDVGNATKKNGEDVDIPLPSDAKSVGEYAEGRTVLAQNSYNDQRDDWMLHFRIEFNALSKESVTIVHSQYGQIITSVNGLYAKKQGAVDLVLQSYFDESGNWYKSDDGVNYQYKNGAAATGTLASVGATDLSTRVEGRTCRGSEQYNQRFEYWEAALIVAHGLSDTRMAASLGGTSLTVKQDPSTTLVREQGWSVSASEFATASAAYASTTDGTLKSFEYTEDKSTGKFDFVGLSITKTPLSMQYRIGPELVYEGFFYNKIPTTDAAVFNADNPPVTDTGTPVSDNYYLVGGYFVSASTWATNIDSTSSLQYVTNRNDDNTWNWKVRHVSEEETSYGEDDPTIDTGRFVFEYGLPNNKIKWTGRYLMKDIASGAVNLVGTYPDIDQNTFGAHPVLSGRRMINRTIRNEQLRDGKVSYDVYENIVTADINDDDEWFVIGVTESLDRVKLNLASQFITPLGNKYPATGNYSPFYELIQSNSFGDLGSDEEIDLDDLRSNAQGTPVYAETLPVLARLQSAFKRRKTVIRSRKYFVRRPTTDDLKNTMDEGSKSLYEAMDAVQDQTTGDIPPDTSKARTYDVVKLSDNLWAVERLEVKIDDRIYVDPDAYDTFKDSLGETLLGYQIVVMHNAAAVKPTSTDRTAP